MNNMSFFATEVELTKYKKCYKISYSLLYANIYSMLMTSAFHNLPLSYANIKTRCSLFKHICRCRLWSHIPIENQIYTTRRILFYVAVKLSKMSAKFI